MPFPISDYVPQVAPRSGLMRRPLVAWSVVVVCALVVLGLVSVAPLLLAGGNVWWGGVIYRAFSAVCHQMRERSFHLKGFPFAVCARCLGVYVGFALGVLVYPLIRSVRRRDAPAREWLFVGALPTGVDFALGFFGIWANTHFSRAVTGGLFGAVAAMYVVPGIVGLAYMNWRSVFSGRGEKRGERFSLTNDG